MYTIDFTVCLIGLREELVRLAQSIKPPAPHNAEFLVADSASVDIIKKSDYIIADLTIGEYKELIDIFKINKKSHNAKLVLVASGSEMTQIIGGG